MARATLGPSGWVLPAESVWARANCGNLGGKLTPGQNPAAFAFLRVNAISGGSSPTVEIRSGGPSGALLRSVSATAGATIDRTSSPDLCPAGIFVAVTGKPRQADITVLFA